MRATLATFAIIVSLFGSGRAVAEVEPSPSVPAGATPPPATPSLDPPVCPADWAARVYRDARASVVRVENIRGFGAGFVVFSPTYVATALHVVSLGRALNVVALDGSRQRATIIAVDEAHDVALLELEHPVAGAVPLIPARRRAIVGAPVLAIGHPLAMPGIKGPWAGLLAWSATEGIVSQVSDGYVQVDAPVNPGNSGGPVLQCDGAVLGVASERSPNGAGLGLAVSISRVEALTSQVGKAPRYEGGGRGAAVVALPIQIDRSSTWVGGAFGAEAIFADRFSLALRAGILGATRTPTASVGSSAGSGPLIHDGGVRLLGEMEARYRVLMFKRPSPAYFIGGVGAAFTYSWLTQTQLGISTVNGCTPKSSVACATITSTDTE